MAQAARFDNNDNTDENNIWSQTLLMNPRENEEDGDDEVYSGGDGEDEAYESDQEDYDYDEEDDEDSYEEDEE